MSFCVENSLCWGVSLSEPNNPKQDFPLWWLGVQVLTEPGTYTCQLIKTCQKGHQEQFSTGSTLGGPTAILSGAPEVRHSSMQKNNANLPPDALFCASVTNRGSEEGGTPKRNPHSSHSPFPPPYGSGQPLVYFLSLWTCQIGRASCRERV